MNRGRHSAVREDYRIRSAKARSRRCRKVRFLYSMITAGLAASVLLVSLMIFSITSRADAGQDNEEKYYTSELVRNDHTVYDIAAEYTDHVHYKSEEDCLREIRSINHLAVKSDGSVYVAPGNCIIVPYYAK